ncbi:MAG: hypothetical protein ACXWP6_06195 [Ktedonobacterales bacterium]
MFSRRVWLDPLYGPFNIPEGILADVDREQWEAEEWEAEEWDREPNVRAFDGLDQGALDAHGGHIATTVKTVAPAQS